MTHHDDARFDDLVAQLGAATARTCSDSCSNAACNS